MTHRLVTPCLAALVLLSSAPALAQDPCSADAFDPVADARRARSVLVSRDLFERHHGLEQRRLREWIVAEDPESPPSMQLYAEFLADTSELDGYLVCNGDLQFPAGLAGGWLGFAAGASFYGNINASLRLFYLAAGDSLSPDAFPDGTRPTEVFGRGQGIYGLTVSWDRWFSLTLGGTEDTLTQFDVSTSSSAGDGTSDADISSSSNIVSVPGTSRFYLGLGIPEIYANLNLIYDPEASTPIAYTFLGLKDFPLFFLDPNFAVTAGGGYFAFEDQPLAELGFSYGFFDGLLEPGVEVAFEFNEPRLRSMRANVEANLQGRFTMPKGFFVDQDNPNFDLADIVPWFGAGLNVRGEASIYNSRYVFERTGQNLLRGYSIAAGGHLAIRLFTIGVEVHNSINDPDTLVRLADAADRSQLGLRFHMRFGW